MRKKTIAFWSVLLLTLAALYFLFWIFGGGNLVIEKMIGRNPEAVLGRYIQAAASGDSGKANAAWDIPENAPADVYPDYYAKSKETRWDIRERVTQDLIAKKISPRFEIENTEWWSTCCMPRILDSSLGAGRVKFRVSLFGGDGQSLIYIFVLEVPGGYEGELERNMIRDWKIYDAYPEEGYVTDTEPIVSGWKVYESERLGFRMDYPSDWKEKDNSPNYSYFINFASADMVNYFEAHEEELTSPYDTADSYYSSKSDLSVLCIESSGGSDTGMSPRKIGDTQIDGEPAGEYITGWEGVQYYMITFGHEGRQYEIRLNNTPDKESVTETQKMMISSFRFLD